MWFAPRCGVGLSALLGTVPFEVKHVVPLAIQARSSGLNGRFAQSRFAEALWPRLRSLHELRPRLGEAGAAQKHNLAQAELPQSRSLCRHGLGLRDSPV